MKISPDELVTEHVGEIEPPAVTLLGCAPVYRFADVANSLLGSTFDNIRKRLPFFSRLLSSLDAASSASNAETT
ncbi:hypothetical protein RMSM_05589 [Rhodopirellula maiorica SM1]|uniref:Uncharacterized protein n=1 Tax=Rhodopirellula maiorica SM1 TaxID=1265738 RepID=M5REH9_9BACT|nr:hypothetical protein RMSM_05589 [Rhodopirellula maiorica SM1]